MNKHDRRSYFRVKETLPIKLLIRDPETKKQNVVEGEALNIGLAGLLISVKELLPKIDRGIIETMLPVPFKTVKARIKIKWRDDQKQYYGLEFTNSPENQLADWQTYIKDYGSSTSDRRQKEIQRRLTNTADDTNNYNGNDRGTDSYSGNSKYSTNQEKRRTLRRISDVSRALEFTCGKKVPVTRANLIPSCKEIDYSNSSAKVRRDWLSNKTGVDLQHIGVFSGDPASLKGNIENFIGFAQIPLGLAGPLKINGEFAKGDFYVPMATTEGALVYTYTQGMQVLSLAGGVNTILLKDELHISSFFGFKRLFEAQKFKIWLGANFQRIKAEAEKTTQYGKLIRIDPVLFDKNVVLTFFYSTGDASGLNMTTIATEAACQLICSITKPEKFYIQSNYSAIKKITAHNFITGYGKTIIAECTIPRVLLKRTFNILPEVIVEYFRVISLSSIHAGMIGLNGHAANGLAAIFMACGQDVASVVESHISIVNYELNENGDLYASVKLPSLVLGTVGGGVRLATQRECLEIMGCYGHGAAKKFSEIIAASVLAGEIVIWARVANGTFVDAHKKYGRKAQNKRPILA